MRPALGMMPALIAIGGCDGRPPDPAMLDGVYSNAACPGFEVRGAAIRVAGRELWGRVGQDKEGYYLIPEKALRYQIGDNGCRLLIVDGDFKHRVVLEEPGGDVVAMEIYSADLKHSMYWEKGSPTDDGAGHEGAKSR